MRRKSKVCQLDHNALLFVLLAHKVLGFQITMHDAQIVHIVKSQAQLVDYAGSLLLSEIPSLLDSIEQISTSDQLHDDVIVSAIFHELEDSSDVGMDCFLQHL